MRLLIAATGAVLALAACTPAVEDPASIGTRPQIESTTAPSVGGLAELPTDGGVTPAPEAMEDATADDVSAAVSPAEAAVRSGGEQGTSRR